MAWPPAKCALGEGKAGVLATRPAPRGWLDRRRFRHRPTGALSPCLVLPAHFVMDPCDLMSSNAILRFYRNSPLFFIFPYKNGGTSQDNGPTPAIPGQILSPHHPSLGGQGQDKLYVGGVGCLGGWGDNASVGGTKGGKAFFTLERDVVVARSVAAIRSAASVLAAIRPAARVAAVRLGDWRRAVDVLDQFRARARLGRRVIVVFVRR